MAPRLPSVALRRGGRCRRRRYDCRNVRWTLSGEVVDPPPAARIDRSPGGRRPCGRCAIRTGSELAGDGIDEWLGRLAERPWPGDPPIGDDKAVTLIATDVDLSWSILGRGNSLRLYRDSTDSVEGVKLAGKATDLFLHCSVDATSRTPNVVWRATSTHGRPFLR